MLVKALLAALFTLLRLHAVPADLLIETAEQLAERFLEIALLRRRGFGNGADLLLAGLAQIADQLLLLRQYRRLLLLVALCPGLLTLLGGPICVSSCVFRFIISRENTFSRLLCRSLPASAITRIWS